MLVVNTRRGQTIGLQLNRTMRLPPSWPALAHLSQVSPRSACIWYGGFLDLVLQVVTCCEPVVRALARKGVPCDAALANGWYYYRFEPDAEAFVGEAVRLLRTGAADARQFYFFLGNHTWGAGELEGELELGLWTRIRPDVPGDAPPHEAALGQVLAAQRAMQSGLRDASPPRAVGDGDPEQDKRAFALANDDCARDFWSQMYCTVPSKRAQQWASLRPVYLEELTEFKARMRGSGADEEEEMVGYVFNADTNDQR